MRLLLVEDEPEMAAALGVALGRYDMILDHAPSLDHAIAAMANQVHDAITPHPQSPDGNALNAHSPFCVLNWDIPEIVLTARGAVDERIKGLEGANSITRRNPSRSRNCWQTGSRTDAPCARYPPMTARIGNLVFDFGGREARDRRPRAGVAAPGTACAGGAGARQGRTVQRSTLEESVYGYDDEIQSNSLDAQCFETAQEIAGVRLRRGDPRHSGVGYLLRPMS